MKDILEKLEKNIQSSNNLNNIIDYCRKYKSNHRINIYIVGGFIRDILIDQKAELSDLDLLIEGDIENFSNTLSKYLNSSLLKAHDFLNYKLVLNTNFTIDVAHARTEEYQSSGSLPKWKVSNIVEDINRRDFTINSIAIEILKDKFQIIDPRNGIGDIKNKTIKVLHDRSFQDDPTRIYRAVKYMTRFGFDLEMKTEQLLKESILSIDNLSKFRKNNEILKYLFEKNFEEITNVLSKPIFSRLVPNKFMNVIGFLDKNYWYSAPIEEKIFFAFLNIDDQSRESFLSSINFSKNSKKNIEKLLKIRKVIEMNGSIDVENSDTNRAFISNLYHCL